MTDSSGSRAAYPIRAVDRVCDLLPDGRCVAIGIEGLPVPAAISVSAPASRFASEDAGRIAHLLRKQSAQLAKAVRALPH